MKFFVLLLLAVAANGLPKVTLRLKQEVEAEKLSSLLMPGPVMLPDKNSVEVEPVEASPECILCEYVLDKLDQMLTQNATEEEIKEALKKVCSLLPSSVSAECTEFIDKYADLVLKYLSQGLNPQMVCTELGLCQGSKLTQANGNDVVEINDVGTTTSCELCTMVARELESLITQNSTQQEIENALEQVCSLLPGDLKNECDQFVEQYLPEILNLLAMEIPPDMLCKELGLCPSMLKVTEVQVAEVNAPRDANLTCDFCLKIIGLAKELASKNETVQNVENLLKLVCYYMLPIIKECKNFIDEVIPKVFAELSKMDPDAICKQLKMCPASTGMSNDVRCFLSDISRCFQP